MVGPLRFYPLYPYCLLVHATFFFFFFSHNSLKRILTIFFFFLKQPDFRKKKCFFCLVVSGVYPPYPLGGPTPTKNFFSVCLPLVAWLRKTFYLCRFPYLNPKLLNFPLKTRLRNQKLKTTFNKLNI